MTAIESEKISAIEKIIAKIAVNIKSEICLEENRILLVATTEPGIQPRELCGNSYAQWGQ